MHPNTVECTAISSQAFSANDINWTVAILFNSIDARYFSHTTDPSTGGLNYGGEETQLYLKEGEEGIDGTGEPKKQEMDRTLDWWVDWISGNDQ